MIGDMSKPRFPTQLAAILPFYGNASALARKAGLSVGTLTRAQHGERELGADSLEAMLNVMSPEHQASLGEAWLMDLRDRIPSASMVRITTAPTDEDRLSRAVALLPASLREKLANVLEAVARDPASGYPMIEGLASLVAPQEPARESFRLNEPSTKYEA